MACGVFSSKASRIGLFPLAAAQRMLAARCAPPQVLAAVASIPGLPAMRLQARAAPSAASAPGAAQQAKGTEEAPELAGNPQQQGQQEASQQPQPQQQQQQPQQVGAQKRKARGQPPVRIVKRQMTACTSAGGVEVPVHAEAAAATEEAAAEEPTASAEPRSIAEPCSSAQQQATQKPARPSPVRQPTTPRSPPPAQVASGGALAMATAPQAPAAAAPAVENLDLAGYVPLVSAFRFLHGYGCTERTSGADLTPGMSAICRRSSRSSSSGWQSWRPK